MGELLSQLLLTTAIENYNRLAVEGREEIPNPGHLDTLYSTDNLASILRAKGNYEEAEELNRKALKTRKQVVGSNHPDTLTSFHSLGETFLRLLKSDEAEEHLQEAYNGRKQKLGANHRDTIRSLNALNIARCRLGRSQIEKEFPTPLKRVKTSSSFSSLHRKSSFIKDRVVEKGLQLKVRYPQIDSLGTAEETPSIVLLAVKLLNQEKGALDTKEILRKIVQRGKGGNQESPASQICHDALVAAFLKKGKIFWAEEAMKLNICLFTPPTDDGECVGRLKFRRVPVETPIEED